MNTALPGKNQTVKVLVYFRVAREDGGEDGQEALWCCLHTGYIELAS